MNVTKAAISFPSEDKQLEGVTRQVTEEIFFQHKIYDLYWSTGILQV